MHRYKTVVPEINRGRVSNAVGFDDYISVSSVLINIV